MESIIETFRCPICERVRPVDESPLNRDGSPTICEQCVIKQDKDALEDALEGSSHEER